LPETSAVIIAEEFHNSKTFHFKTCLANLLVLFTGYAYISLAFSANNQPVGS